jgi:MSHA pilin protein MshC
MRAFKKSSSGFTLIELVAVMVVLGVLAVTAVPRFSGSQDFEAYSARDQIIAAARMAQQYAMYDRAAGACYRLNIAANRLQVQAAGVNIGPSQGWRDGIDIDAAIAINGGAGPGANVSVFFDGLGNAIDACPAAGGSPTATTITMTPFGLNVCINAVGYINAC